MLAVKLHKKPKPWLGTGSHLVPIVNWKIGKVQIRNWIAELTQNRLTPWPNNSIRYLTLVQVPDDHLVRRHYLRSYIKLKSPNGEFMLVNSSWDSWPGDNSYLPLHEIEMSWIGSWRDAIRSYHHSGIRSSRKIKGLLPDGGGPRVGYPELILGSTLPPKFIKWTKDIDVLYGQAGYKRKQKQVKNED